MYFNLLITIIHDIIENFLKFTSLFRKLDKDDNRNGDAKSIGVRRKNIACEKFKSLSQSLRKLSIFPENLKILEIRVIIWLS